MGFENPFIPALKGQGFLAPTTVNLDHYFTHENQQTPAEKNTIIINAIQQFLSDNDLILLARDVIQDKIENGNDYYIPSYCLEYIYKNIQECGK